MEARIGKVPKEEKGEAKRGMSSIIVVRVLSHKLGENQINCEPLGRLEAKV